MHHQLSTTSIINTYYTCSYATCCNAAEHPKITFDCLFIGGVEEASGSIVACPSTDYFMTSCSGGYGMKIYFFLKPYINMLMHIIFRNAWREVNSWIVEDNQKTECVVRSAGTRPTRSV